jgi:putative DNA primase/helicase
MDYDPVGIVLDRLYGVTGVAAQKTGDGHWKSRCPSHEDRDPSLSVTRGDKGCLVKCFSGCGRADILHALGLKDEELFFDYGQNGNGHAPARIVATYDYFNADGSYLYQVVRFDPKDFRQRKPDGNGGWARGTKGLTRVLYCLPEVAAADPASFIFIVEGEKDADNLRGLGQVATCNAGGVGAPANGWNWRDSYGEALAGRNVVIIPDLDKRDAKTGLCPGQEHAWAWAAALRGKAASVRILPLPSEGKDFSDWLRGLPDGADAVAELLCLVSDVQPYAGEPLPEKWRQNIPEIKRAVSGDSPPILSPSAPLPAAREYAHRVYRVDNTDTLLRHAGEFYAWSVSRYGSVTDERMRAMIWSFCGEAKQRIAVKKEGEDNGWQLIPYQPTASRVSNIFDALISVAHRGDLCPPCWLSENGHDLPPASEIIPCRNGILHWPTMTLRSTSPSFFCTYALDLDYTDAAMEPPAEWMRFLESLWPKDPQSIDSLQDWFGYVIGGSTRLQKILLVLGPKRSGKGTIARILTALLGPENVAGPTLASFDSNFGMQVLVGRPLAIIADARLSGRQEQSPIVERLLTISGEDAVTIDRKHKDPVTVRLPTRLMLLTNELPRLTDSSGALASRFVVLRLMESWLGHEDTGLYDRLAAELPQILYWAIQGLQRVTARGRLVQPESSEQAIAELEEIGSPITAFARDRCEVDVAAGVSCDGLFTAWKSWCTVNGREHAGNKQTFGRDLRAAFPKITVSQIRSGDRRDRWYDGIGLQNVDLSFQG